MAGYVIHIAIANEYVKKHDDIENHEEFIKGTIYPDSVKDKSQTHYGPNSSNPNLVKFLEEHKEMSDFEKGYFLHLVSDYIFYRILDENPDDRIYSDYDILNDELVEKYNVKVPKEIENVIHSKQGDLTYLSIKLVENFIEDVSNESIEEYITEIMENPQKWLDFNC